MTDKFVTPISTPSPPAKPRDAAQLAQDRAAVAQALLAYQARIEHLSDQISASHGAKLGEALPDFLTACDAARREADASLTEIQRAAFTPSARHLAHLELEQLAAAAANRHRRHWDQTLTDLVHAQIRWVTRWPITDALFRQCAESGLSAIEDHLRLTGQDQTAIDAAQAAFLSDLTADRLLALAGPNIAQAIAVYEQYCGWLAPDRARHIQDLLASTERTKRGEILADSIASSTAAPQEWASLAARAAEAEYPTDAAFANQLAQAVDLRRAAHDAAQRNEQRRHRNLLLRGALTGATTLDQLLSSHPQAAQVWATGPETLRQNLMTVLKANAGGTHCPIDANAMRIYAVAIGGCHCQPNRFQAEDFTHPAWNALPNRQRLHLIALQDGSPLPAHHQAVREASLWRRAQSSLHYFA